MAVNVRAMTALLAMTLVTVWVIPAAAIELPAQPAGQKAAAAAIPAKRPVRHAPITVASIGLTFGQAIGPRWAFPILLGVAY